MSTNQITPERIAESIVDARERVAEGELRTWSEHRAIVYLADALESSRAEVQRLTEERSIKACECSPEEACAHVRRAEAAEREVQRLTEESRRSGEGRVEVPDLPGHIWASAHDADSRDQCISEVRDWYRDWIFAHLASSPQPSADVVRVFARDGEILVEERRGNNALGQYWSWVRHATPEEIERVREALHSSTNHDSKETP